MVSTAGVKPRSLTNAVGKTGMADLVGAKPKSDAKAKTWTTSLFIERFDNVLDCRRILLGAVASPARALCVSHRPPSAGSPPGVLQEAYQAVSSASGGSSAAGATGASFGALAESLEPQQHERMKLQAAEMT